MVHPNRNHSHMHCRDYVKLPLNTYGIDVSIGNQILKTPHILLFHLSDLENGRKPYIGTLEKDRGDIFSECCAKIFKAKLLFYDNEVRFEMVKTSFKNACLVGTTNTALQNEVSTCHKCIMIKRLGLWSTSQQMSFTPLYSSKLMHYYREFYYYWTLMQPSSTT